MSVTVERFAGDPFAPASAQFALKGSTLTERRDDQPSAVGARPWGLRRARPAGQSAVIPAWRYDDGEQIAVDAESGLPLIAAPDGAALTERPSPMGGGPFRVC